ncbi:unnamed protein product [Tenebrio molitor]|nr:unnamed protein product [Tenebrio molitor]
MMKGYSSICVNALESAWRFTSANVKGVVFTENSKFNSMSFKEEVNYCLLIDDNILRHIDAVSKIIQEYLLLNYEVPEKAYTKINLPITVFIPLYIAQSFVATRKHCLKF